MNRLQKLFAEETAEEVAKPKASSKNYPGIIRSIRLFSNNSPYGNPDVLVLPAVRPVFELSHILYKYGGFLENPSEHFKNIIRQFFTAVAFLHKHGVVHGDIRLGNVGYLCENMTEDDVTWLSRFEMRSTTLWRYPDEPSSTRSGFSEEFKSQRPHVFGKPLPPDIEEHLPRYLVRSTEWEEDIEEFQSYRATPRIVLFDFSYSFTKDTPLADRPHVAMPRSYRPPEYCFPTQ